MHLNATFSMENGSDPSSNLGGGVNFLYFILLLFIMIGVTLLIVAVLIAAIWIVIEMQRLRHKFFAFFLIGLILFLYISGYFVLGDKEIDYTSFSGVLEAGGLYFSWIGSIFGNVVSITSNAIKMDWGGNETSGGG